MRASLPTELLRTVRLETWKALFAACQAASLFPTRRPTYDAVELALKSPSLPAPLARAIYMLLASCTEAARTDVYNAAAALQFPHRFPDAISPTDLVASLIAEGASNADVAELLRAVKRLCDRRFRPIEGYFFVGRSRGHAVDLKTHLPLVHRAIEPWVTASDFGTLSVSYVEEGDNVTFDVVHEGRKESRLLTTGEAATFRPLHTHQAIWNRARGTLYVRTDWPEAVTPLAMAFGCALFDDRKHFLVERAIDLSRLQELGREALVVPGLIHKMAVTAVGGTWHSGKNHAMTPRGQDFFEALEIYKIRIEGGRLEQITLRADLKLLGGAPAQCDISIRPPHSLSISEPEVAELIFEYLDSARFTNPGTPLRDFFSQQPWIDSREGWIGLIGETEFNALLRDGLLTEHRANPITTPPDHPHAGRAARAYAVSDDKYIAWSQDLTLLPFVVREEQLSLYALSFEKLASRMAADLGLEGPAKKLDEDGVLFCGSGKIGPLPYYLYLLTRPVRGLTLDRLRDKAARATPVFIAPAGRFETPGLYQVPMPPLASSFKRFLPVIARALRVEEFVPVPLLAPEDARIVVERARRRVWFDGVSCDTLTPGHVRLLEFLITEDKPVESKLAADKVAAGRNTDDTMRRALESLAEGIGLSFRDRGLPVPEGLDSMVTRPRRGYYVLRLKGHII